MKKNDQKEELKFLKKEIKSLTKRNEKLLDRLEKITLENKELRKELKKNDVTRIVLSEEQHQLLLSLSKGISTPNSSSD